MPVITDISPLPFDSFSATLTAGTDTVLDPQPYNNTKEVVLLNTSSADAMWVKCLVVVPFPSASTITVSPITSAPGVPLVGETITLNGATLTAAAGPYVSGTDTFSVDARATSTATVNAGFSVGDTITLRLRQGSESTYLRTLTGIAGARAAGSLDFTVDANTTTQAANIVAAIIDSNFGNDPITGPTQTGANVSASNVGNVITVTAGFRYRGTDGNTSALTSGKTQGLQLTASLDTPADLTITDFTGGVNADGGITRTDGSTERNRPEDYAQNIATALRDGANTFDTAGFTALYRGEIAGNYLVRAEVISPAGSAGDGLAVTEAMTGVAVTSPTAGGVDATALSAANSTIIPAGGALTLSIGPEGNRSPLQTDTQWGLTPGANIAIVATMETGGADADINVTYVNNRGYPFGV